MLHENLDYVLAVAEEKNLTRAAARLYISQPALTYYLNRLEEDLGVTLFDRTHIPIRITPAGIYYLEKMKAVNQMEQTLRSELKTIAAPHQIFRLGIGQVRGHYWLPDILPPFCESHPEVSIQVCQLPEMDMIRSMRDGELDMAIGPFPASIPDLETVDLLEEKICMIGHRKFHLIPEEERANYSFDKPYRIQAEALNGLPFIIPGFSNGLYYFYDRFLKQNQILPSRTIMVSNSATGTLLAERGLGIQMISGSSFRESEAEKREMDFFVTETMSLSRKCQAVYLSGGQKKELIDGMLRILQEYLSNV